MVTHQGKCAEQNQRHADHVNADIDGVVMISTVLSRRMGSQHVLPAGRGPEHDAISEASATAQHTKVSCFSRLRDMPLAEEVMLPRRGRGDRWQDSVRSWREGRWSVDVCSVAVYEIAMVPARPGDDAMWCAEVCVDGNWMAGRFCIRTLRVGRSIMKRPRQAGDRPFQGCRVVVAARNGGEPEVR